MTINSNLEALFLQLSCQLNVEQETWLRQAEQLITAEENPKQQLESYIQLSAITRRKLGSDTINTTVDLKSWRIDEVARLKLLVNLLQYASPAIKSQHIITVFKCGDENEQIAIIKALELLDQKGELLSLALATGRTNSLNLFSALALNNRYPAKHYDERAFHQLVLKALFMDLDISHIIDLKQRLSATLSQLAIDLIKERIAAHRPPPTSISYAIQPLHLEKEDLQKYNLLLNSKEISISRERLQEKINRS